MTPPSDAVMVRTADGDDLLEVVTVGRESMVAAYGETADPAMVQLLVAKFWTPEANIDAIRAGRTFVAELDGRIVGIATYGLAKGHSVLWKLYVLPELQGQGIGHRLLGAVIDNLAFDHVNLWMPIEDGSVLGRRFAVKEGFVEHMREEQAGMPDLVWMRKQIREESA